MKLSRADLRKMIVAEANNLNGPKETVHKVTVQELRNIISEEMSNISSGKKRQGVLKEGVVSKAIEMIKPMIAAQFERVGEDGDYWAGEIIDSLLDAGLDNRVTWRLPGLLANTEAQDDIKSVLNFDPMVIISAEYPGPVIKEIGLDVLQVLIDHGYAN